MVPNDSDVELAIYGNVESDVPQNYFFNAGEWQEFKHEMPLKTKWSELKKQLVSNQMKIKIVSMQWSLKQIVKRFLEAEEYQQICMAKLALTVPVANEWPERGGSAIKRIKTCIRSSMKTIF